jgi:copper(I)-binding protein
MKYHWIPSLLLAAAFSAHAQTAAVSVEGAWVRASVQGQTTTGAYMTLTAREPLTLTGASTPVAAVADVHEMKMEGDVMRMRPVEGLALAPGKPVALQPGGYHIMLTQLKATLKPQTSIPLTLIFRDAKGATSELRLSVPVAVQAPR